MFEICNALCIADCQTICSANCLAECQKFCNLQCTLVRCRYYLQRTYSCKISLPKWCSDQICNAICVADCQSICTVVLTCVTEKSTTPISASVSLQHMMHC